MISVKRLFITVIRKIIGKALYYEYLLRKNRQPKRVLQYLSNKSNPAELPVIILITSYNNALYCMANIQSVLMQHYKNYTVIYIDDCSTDTTLSLVESHIPSKERDRWQIIRNTTRCGKLANLYTHIHALAANSIVIELDGDDALAHPYVLHHISTLLQTTNADFLYANYQNGGAMQDNIGHHWAPTPRFIAATKLFRLYPWIYSGLRVFKAFLFQQISPAELTWQQTGKFFPVCHDLAYTYAMLERAQKIAWIEEPILLRTLTPHNDKLQWQQQEIISIRKQIQKMV